MKYTDIPAPMTDEEWQAARRNAHVKARNYALAAITIGVLLLGFAIFVCMPLIGLQSLTGHILTSPWWYLGGMFAAGGGLFAIYDGLAEWPAANAPATGRMRSEATELDPEGREQLFKLAAEVPEIQAIVTAWYAAGRRMNVRALRDLQHVKEVNDEAEADAQLQASIAERFSAKAAA